MTPFALLSPGPMRTVVDDILRREDPAWFTPAGPRLINQASDRGGMTRGGVTAVALGEYLGLGRPATSAELTAMTLEDARQLIYARHVVKPGLEAVPDQKTRALLADWHTNSGGHAIEALQRIYAARGVDVGRVDGVIGDHTRAALLTDRQPVQTYSELVLARIEFYLLIAFDAEARAFLAAHPKCQLANLRGWIRRAAEFIP